MEVENRTNKKLSLIQLARQLMESKKQAMPFKQLYNEIIQIKGLNEAEKKANMSQFYTDLNADGIFTINRENHWVLKKWHQNEYKSGAYTE